jgi:glucose dehydrogenase
MTRGDWLQYGNDQGGTRFSPLTQITPRNVEQLEVAWEADTGPAVPGMKVSLEVTPINVGDALYLCNAYNSVISLDAETGHERWRHNMTRETPPSAKPCRAEWGSVSVDIDRGIMMVNWMRLPSRVELITRAEARERGFRLFDGNGQGSLKQPMENTPYAVQTGPLLSPLGMPCSTPPWGLITAVDLISGRVIWNKPFGTGRDSGPFGIPSHLPFTMGVPNIGGPVTTRSGLVFIAATVERTIRAYDVSTGEQLWQARLPGGGQATPMTYRSARSGRQFVVIAAGGKPMLQSRLSTKIVAYALPR